MGCARLLVHAKGGQSLTLFVSRGTVLLGSALFAIQVADSRYTCTSTQLLYKGNYSKKNLVSNSYEQRHEKTLLHMRKRVSRLTGTARNGPERTETDFRGYRNGLPGYRNGL